MDTQEDVLGRGSQAWMREQSNFPGTRPPHRRARGKLLHLDILQTRCADWSAAHGAVAVCDGYIEGIVRFINANDVVRPAS